jgi:hypothetical protein
MCVLRCSSPQTLLLPLEQPSLEALAAASADQGLSNLAVWVDVKGSQLTALLLAVKGPASGAVAAAHVLSEGLPDHSLSAVLSVSPWVPV